MNPELSSIATRLMALASVAVGSLQFGRIYFFRLPLYCSVDTNGTAPWFTAQCCVHRLDNICATDCASLANSELMRKMWSVPLAELDLPSVLPNDEFLFYS